MFLITLYASNWTGHYTRHGLMDSADFPALFRSADEASNSHQRVYLALIGCEYILLISASILSMPSFETYGTNVAYLVILVILIGMLLYRNVFKPEMSWYQCRALAESVKTLSWRYAMRASPFIAKAQEQESHSEFRNQLRRLFDENRATIAKSAPALADKEQITRVMERLRSEEVGDRLEAYVEHRVNEQRSWYAGKAAENRRRAVWWTTIGVVSYVLAALLALGRVNFDEFHIWPIDPVLVFAASVIGWMQVKKFGELEAAYSVAAHEIGIIKSSAMEVKSEADLATFVTDSELAFSREHTLWAARRAV